MAERPRLNASTGIVAGLAVLLVIALLLTPATQDVRGTLTSYSAAPGGARALHDLMQRLGWRVERRDVPLAHTLDTTAVYAVLAPPVLVTASEVHDLLQTVRAGAGLLVVVPEGGPLADSLGVSHSRLGGVVARDDEAPEGFCPDSLDRTGLITWPDGRINSWWLESRRRADTVFLRVRSDSGRTSRSIADSAAEGRLVRLGMAGFALGRGRVVAVADPDLLRNDVLRVCRWNAGPTAVAALHWLATTSSRHLVFDEYHQNPNTEAAPMRAVRRALVAQPWGRMTLALAVAGLLLLAALGVRPIAPSPRVTIERRSPLEHVSALARAYAQAGATRLTVRRLVRGLRRRHAIGAATRGDDTRFLDSLAQRHPELTSDVQTVARALEAPVRAAELTTVGDAVARIDSRLRPQP